MQLCLQVPAVAAALVAFIALSTATPTPQGQDAKNTAVIIFPMFLIYVESIADLRVGNAGSRGLPTDSSQHRY